MRATYLDGLRGLAVVWMFIFHFTYDLKLLGFIDWNFHLGFWFAFPRFIAFTFLFCVGAALNYVHQPFINWKLLGQRTLRIGAASLAVSVSTYFIFPSHWIFFGTLHCILFGSVFGALLVNHKEWSFIIMLTILLLQYGLGFDIKWVSAIVQRPSMDFIPIYPWFWAILLGMLSGPYLAKMPWLNRLPVHASLKFLGHHSLLIYLVHQPVIYGILMIIKSLI